MKNVLTLKQMHGLIDKFGLVVDETDLLDEGVLLEQRKLFQFHDIRATVFDGVALHSKLL